MDWLPVLAIVSTNIAILLAKIGMILWFRSESREDWKHLYEKTDANRRETLSILESIRLEIFQFKTETHSETKDFHGRLCKIEENRQK